MGGIDLPFSESIKYLGVILDGKLLWMEHINLKIRLAKANLIKLKGIFGRTGGPSPSLLKWAYTGIVIPVLSYGSIISGRATSKRYPKNFSESTD